MKPGLASAIGLLIAAMMFLSGQIDAADNTSDVKLQAPALLSVDDQKRYEEALNLIHIFSGAGDHLQRAFSTLNGLAASNPSSGYPYAGLAELKFRLADMGDGSHQEAFTLAQRAIQIDPNIADAHIVVSKAMLRMGNVAAAIEAANKAIALAPNKPEAMFVKGQIAVTTQKYDEAEKWYHQSIERLTDNQRRSNIYSWIGRMHAERRPPSIPAATAAYEKAVDLANDQAPWRLNNAASFLIENTERYDQAIDYLNRALKIMNFGRARTNLGLAHYYRWGDAYLNPSKYRDTKQILADQKTITARTGVTPEYAFVMNPLGPRPPSATLAMLKTGMVKDVDVRPPGTDQTALVAAAYGNHLDLVKLLVEKGANVNAEDTDNKSTAIFYAVANKNLEMVKFFGDHGARVNLIDGAGEPLLRRALTIIFIDRTKDFRVFEYLLSKGADASIPNRTGQSTAAYVVQSGDLELARLLSGNFRTDPHSR